MRLGEYSEELRQIVSTLADNADNCAPRGGKKHYQQPRHHRKLTNYEKCMLDIRRKGASGVFAMCKGVRTKKRVQCHVNINGTIGTMITAKRFPNSRIICTCKSRAI